MNNKILLPVYEYGKDGNVFLWILKAADTVRVQLALHAALRPPRKVIKPEVEKTKQ